MIQKLSLTLAALALALPVALAQDSKPAPEAKPAPAAVASSQLTEKQVIAAEKPAYPLATCVVSGEKLGDGAVERVIDGHLVRLCCKDCVAKVEKDPATFRQKVVDAVLKEQKSTYPLTTCPVTGEKLGADAVDHVYGTRLVRLKDKAAIANFEKNPAEFMAKVDKVYVDTQLASYKAKTCPVSGEELGKDAVNRLYGTKLVRLCCNGCVKKFEAAPEKFLAEVAKAK